MSDYLMSTNDDHSTPMMKQYKEFKERYPDIFMFFRCGDFYEIFGEDAVVVSKILNITLTKRGNVPMCGVPYFSIGGYTAKMSNAGTTTILGGTIVGAVGNSNIGSAVYGIYNYSNVTLSNCYIYGGESTITTVSVISALMGSGTNAKFYYGEGVITQNVKP